MTDSSMLVFGSETSCSSSDGSCSQVSLGREIKQQDIGFQNFMFRDHQNMNKFMMNINHDGGQEYVNQWTRNRNGYIFHTEQTTLDYDLQVIRNLICRNSRGNSNNAYLTVDENKTEEKGVQILFKKNFVPMLISYYIIIVMTLVFVEYLSLIHI